MDAIADQNIYTPVDQALTELRRRRQDRDLVARVAAFLGNDIPDYLLSDDCFVLARHIATPNNEALYVLEQAHRHGAMAVFSQDPNDMFTSVNNLKRRLARPEICQETATGRAYRKLDILDVPAAEGLALKNLRCRDGRRLIDFHNGLFEKVEGTNYRIVDDSDWIDRNHRGDMMSHYRRFLALFVTHGILFEEFETGNDEVLRQQIVRPLLAEMWGKLGARPLIVQPYREEQDTDEVYYLAHRSSVLVSLTD